MMCVHVRLWVHVRACVCLCACPHRGCWAGAHFPFHPHYRSFPEMMYCG